jgi:hypothetical protein
LTVAAFGFALRHTWIAVANVISSVSQAAPLPDFVMPRTEKTATEEITPSTTITISSSTKVKPASRTVERESDPIQQEDVQLTRS